MATYIGDRLYGWTDTKADPEVLYTTSATLTVGMPLYNGDGTDTNLIVASITDNTFVTTVVPHSYSITYDETEYTVSTDGVPEGIGAFITDSTQETINLGTDFTITHV